MDVMNIWNTVKYGWIINTKSSFEEGSPVWLLGRCYDIKTKKVNKGKWKNVEVGIDAADDEEKNTTDFEGFMLDFVIKIWLTYRKNFPVIQNIDNNYNSDCGWGCMLRCGQMMLAQGLICHFLGRNWRWKKDINTRSLKKDEIQRKIIQWFGDSPSPDNPFSIHNLVFLGKQHGHCPKDLYGPTFVAHLLKKAVDNDSALAQTEELKELRMYVAKNCNIYLPDIVQTNKENCDNIWKPLIILIPIYLCLLGKSTLENKYPFVKYILSQDNCIGLIAGRTNSHHALYVVGYQNNDIIYLDPHYLQNIANLDAKEPDISLEISYHCSFPRKMNASKIDSSCCIGFYCRTKNDFLDFKNHIETNEEKHSVFIRFCDVDLQTEKNPSINVNEYDFTEDFIVL